MNENRLTASLDLVCVVIPVYKALLSEYEAISFGQCVQVLGHYPVILACPESLNISAYTQLFPSLSVQRFSDSYFTSVQSYNQLMLSTTFYESFMMYRYMLIHQLDAFVFRDDLTAWCNRGFDYIGAPWLHDRDFNSRTEELIFNAKKKLATWLNLKKADGVTPREIITLNQVGNGGLSLRRVAALHKSLLRFAPKIAAYEAQTLHQYNEDVFFSIEVNRYWPHLKVPDFRTALKFAVEFYPERAIGHHNQGELPFGCHAWDIHGTAYWRPIFARMGYQI